MADIYSYSNTTTGEKALESSQVSGDNNVFNTQPLEKNLTTNNQSELANEILPKNQPLENTGATVLPTATGAETAGELTEQLPEQAVPTPDSQPQESEHSAYQQAVKENIEQINREKEQQEIAAAREEIRQAQTQVQQSGDTAANHQLDKDVETFINQQNKGVFHRGMFAAITFFTAYHHKKAQRELASRRSTAKSGGNITYGERDQEQQQNSQNLG